MAKGKLILICQSGGEFVTNDDGTMSYNGGEANAANVTSETPFSDLKLTLAETCDVNQDTATVKYFLPGNKRNLITVKNDKDVKRMIDFHGDALTAEVFVMGTPGFNRSALETQTNSFKRNVKGPFHGDGKSYLPFHFLAAAHAVRLVGFKKATEQIKQISSQAYDWVMQIEPQHWTTSSFKGERYNHIIDDVGASFSKLMEDYRELPILHKTDAIIRTMIDAVNDAKLDGSMWSTHLTPSKEKQLQEENMSSSGLKVLISSDTLFEVREDSTHVVNISTWSCTCLGWKETGLPCRHALAVFALIGRNPYEFCSSYFTVDAYRLTYFESINPVPIEKEEVEKIEIEQVAGETELVLNIEGDMAETGEKIEVEEEKVETETKIDNDECEKVEIEDEKGEKMEIEITWGENDESGKVEGEKVEIEKDEGGKGKIAEDDDARVLVLPPIPVKTVDVMKEKMDWDETEVETKRTVTCTKCKQPGHNKKSCNLYQLQQEAC
ncbi:putative transcription factor interactor and regulator CCHC(Zn) family [Helianthus annuus]|nr:putative transcription factor interactor and regulator CCHC(Zn) family [Helianthus annuus]